MSEQIQSFDFGQPLATLAAAAAGGNSADQLNVGHKGVKVYINVTAITGTTPVLQVIIEAKDPASGQYKTILDSAATIAATGLFVLTVYPGLTNVTSVAQSDVLPPTWRVRWVITGTTPAVTATLGASKLA